MKHKQQKIELITWVDSRFAEDGWLRPSEIDQTPTTAETVGWVILETEDILCMASSRGLLSQYCGVIVIPQVCVTSRTKLRQKTK